MLIVVAHGDNGSGYSIRWRTARSGRAASSRRRTSTSASRRSTRGRCSRRGSTSATACRCVRCPRSRTCRWARRSRPNVHAAPGTPTFTGWIQIERAGEDGGYPSPLRVRRAAGSADCPPPHSFDGLACRGSSTQEGDLTKIPRGGARRRIRCDSVGVGDEAAGGIEHGHGTRVPAEPGGRPAERVAHRSEGRGLSGAAGRRITR